MHFHVITIWLLLYRGDASTSSISRLEVTLVINKCIVNKVEICQNSTRMSLDFSIRSAFFNDCNKCVLFVSVNHPENGQRNNIRRVH